MSDKTDISRLPHARRNYQELCMELCAELCYNIGTEKLQLVSRYCPTYKINREALAMADRTDSGQFHIRKNSAACGDGEGVFTKAMKKTHTILLPQMLEYHSPFLQAAFEGSGYRFAVMQGGKSLKNKAHRYINSDYCYPGVLIVGQFLDALENGKYPPDKIAFMEPQAGGACRAGNYYHVIRNTMKKCGHAQVPVISLNYKGMEKQPGFRITPRLFLNAMAAVCFGDLVMSLYQQVKPYECRKGETDGVRGELEASLAARLRKGCLRKKGRLAAYRHILERFGQIPVSRQPKKRVGISGEIYIKFSSLGNHRLEDYLDRQNCQIFMGSFVNYCIYVLDSDYRSYMADRTRPVLGAGYEAALGYLKRVQGEMYLAVKEHGRFETDLAFDELKKKAENISGCDCITGDGWLVAAEAAEAIEKGCRHVLIVHPFGCLVSHVCERGILNRLRSLYPHANIQTIEYDYDSSDTLRESRIQMALGEF